VSERAAAASDDRVVVGEERASPLELFFDLVFVFALTQVARVIAADPSFGGFARAAVLLAALWYAWICFAWLTNSVDLEDTIERVGVLLGAGASFLVALAVPAALSEDVWLFVGAYFALRVLHVALYTYGLRDDRDARAAILRLAPTFIVGPALLFALPWVAEDWRLVILVAALAVDVSSPYLAGVSGFRVRARHFAERFSLFVILTLGETAIAIGTAAQRQGISAAETGAAALAFALAVTLWWAYFDIVALAAEERLSRAQSAERAVLARDAYTYIHYLLVAGVVVFAYGCMQMVTAATEQMTTAGSVALCGGVALYQLGHSMFRLRMTRSYGVHHLAAAAASLALLAAAPQLPAILCGGLLGAIVLAALAWERYELRDLRRRLHTRAGLAT
jgi:low temperature requirement protein LtrA